MENTCPTKPKCFLCDPLQSKFAGSCSSPEHPSDVQVGKEISHLGHCRSPPSPWPLGHLNAFLPTLPHLILLSSIAQLVSQSHLPATGCQGVGLQVGNRMQEQRKETPLAWSQPGVTARPLDLLCHQEGTLLDYRLEEFPYLSLPWAHWSCPLYLASGKQGFWREDITSPAPILSLWWGWESAAPRARHTLSLPAPSASSVSTTYVHIVNSIPSPLGSASLPLPMPSTSSKGCSCAASSTKRSQTVFSEYRSFTSLGIFFFLMQSWMGLFSSFLLLIVCY